MPFKRTLYKSLMYLLLAIALSAILILATLFASAPYVAKTFLQNYNIDLEIDDTYINPLTGYIRLKNLRIADTQSDTPIHVTLFIIDLEILRLFQGELIINNITIDNTHIPIKKEINTLQVAGIETDRFAKTDSSSPDSKQPKNTMPFGWNNIILKNIRFTYSANDENQHTKSINAIVNSLYVGNTSSLHADKKTALKVQASVENIQIKSEGESSLLSPSIIGQAKITVSDINLSEVSHIVSTLALQAPKELALSSGKIDFNSNANWSINQENSTLTLKEPSIKTSELALALENKQGIIDQSITINSHFLAEKIIIDMANASAQGVDIKINDSNIGYTNLQHQPKTTINFDNFELAIDAIDSSDQSKPSHVTLNTHLSEFGSIAVIADTYFANIGANSTFAVNAEQINITQFSGFAQPALNRKINKGAMDFNFSGSIKEQQILSNSKISMHQLGLTKVDNKSSESSGFESQLGMPLNTALNLLRDKNDSIHLKIPITGSLDDPKININSIINTAILKTMKTAVLTQLGPLMALSALDSIKSLADAAKLKPIVFDKNSSALDETAQKDLEKLAGFLKKRKKISLNVCAWAARFETKNDEKLLALAKQRAIAAKTYLIEQQIDGKRLILCAPEIDSQENAKPRVDFSL